jgi:methylenetetrahydrofolate--tRNA-(uracil-5-)-methyltransferase
MVPALKKAEFVRFGVMHRNTFINSPALLTPALDLKLDPSIFFAGQITGVEGYVESAMTGIIAGINVYRLLENKPLIIFPEETAIGSLIRYITSCDPEDFQPMGINYGIMKVIEAKSRKEMHRLTSERALNTLRRCIDGLQI